MLENVCVHIYQILNFVFDESKHPFIQKLLKVLDIVM